MREALARHEQDFLLYDRPRKGSGRSSGRLRAVWRVATRKPWRTLGVLAFAGVAAAVVVNALALQAGRHPAPLFPETAATRGKVVRLKDMRAAPPPRVATPSLRLAEPPPASVEAPPVVASPPRPARDPIGDLIRGDAVEPRLVMSAQRALAKLGYGPLTADGLLGAETRLAVERFEKDKGLPVSGKLSPRVAKTLAAASGLPIE